MRRSPFASFCLSLTLLTGSLHASKDDKSPTLDEIISQHINYLGGSYKLASFHSLRLDGVLITPEGQSIDIITIKKRPDKIRMMLSNEHRKVIIGYNGKNSWAQTSVNGQLLPQSQMEASATEDLIRSSYIFNALTLHQSSGFTYKLVGEDRVDDTPVYAISVTRPDLSGQEIYYLSQDDYSVLQLDVDKPDANGNLQRIRSRYYDYRPVQDVPMPHRLETALSDGESQSIRWEAITPNPGIFDYYFEPQH